MPRRKEMEGDVDQRRKMAREARREGKKPSEVGATLGASKQINTDSNNLSHQEKLDLKRQGKQDQINANTPEAKPGSRDGDTLDRERYPKLDHQP